MKEIQKVLTLCILSFFCSTACTNLSDNSKDSIVSGETGIKLDTTLTPYIEIIFHSTFYIFLYFYHLYCGAEF
jgi:hypothetical protein